MMSLWPIVMSSHGAGGILYVEAAGEQKVHSYCALVKVTHRCSVLVDPRFEDGDDGTRR